MSKNTLYSALPVVARIDYNMSISMYIVRFTDMKRPTYQTSHAGAAVMAANYATAGSINPIGRYIVAPALPAFIQEELATAAGSRIPTV